VSNTIRLPQLAWHGVSDLELKLPEQWQVEVCNMKGFCRRALSSHEIREAIRNPNGMPPIRQSAKNRKQVVIIFDDIQRATRVAQIVPFILEELAEAGIRDEQIQFIAATACHTAMNRYDFVKKLGEETLRRFPVYSHNAFGNCRDIGTTSRGTHILANAEVMDCDFKIAIGSVVPHTFAGFGGGAKIILPGICHYQTCLAFHRLGSRYAQRNKDNPADAGVFQGNVLRLDTEEAGEMVGLDIKIDTLMNSYGETVAVYAGSLKSAYPMAVEDARQHYDTVPGNDADIVIANTFAKVAECESGLDMAFPSIRTEGGEVVLIGNAPEGHVEHYLAGPWGKNTRSGFQIQCSIPANVNRLIVYTEYPDLTLYGYFAQPEKVAILSGWNEVLALLKKYHPGNSRVVVYPDADIQYWSKASASKVLSFSSGE
jgi:nickel-dependent lactate racemase